MLVEAPALSTHDCLALEGIVISGHVGRNVSRVQLGSTTAYLKREHRVRWRDRFRNWRDGFGWVSLSQREAKLLDFLQRHHLHGPSKLTSGEVKGQAFLLVEAVPNAVELRHCAHVTAAFAHALGSTIARLHDAGVDQPDLFAKHVLLNPSTNQFTLIDWQRATLRTTVTLPQRVRSLAALLATSVDDPTTPPPWWEAFIVGYMQVAEAADLLPNMVSATALQLQQRSSIRKQRTVGPIEQPLVRIAGETVCAIPAIAEQVQSPAAIAWLYDLQRTNCVQQFGAYSGLLQVARYRSPWARWLAKLRGKAWRSDELRTARLLFHMERFGIPAPKLFAYGQRTTLLNAESFVLYEALPAEPLRHDTERSAALTLVQALHRANCLVCDTRAFGVRAGRVLVSNPLHVQLCRRLSAKQMAANLRQCEAWLEACG